MYVKSAVFKILVLCTGFSTSNSLFSLIRCNMKLCILKYRIELLVNKGLWDALA